MLKDGPVVTKKIFTDRADAVRWLADWAKDDIEGNDDLSDEAANSLLTLYDSGQHDKLIGEFPCAEAPEYLHRFGSEPLQMGIDEVEANEQTSGLDQALARLEQAAAARAKQELRRIEAKRRKERRKARKRRRKS